MNPACQRASFSRSSKVGTRTEDEVVNVREPNSMHDTLEPIRLGLFFSIGVAVVADDRLGLLIPM